MSINGKVEPGHLRWARYIIHFFSASYFQLISFLHIPFLRATPRTLDLGVDVRLVNMYFALNVVAALAAVAASPLTARDNIEHLTTIVSEETTQPSTDECQRWRLTKDTTGMSKSLLTADTNSPTDPWQIPPPRPLARSGLLAPMAEARPTLSAPSS